MGVRVLNGEAGEWVLKSSHPELRVNVLEQMADFGAWMESDQPGAYRAMVRVSVVKILGSWVNHHLSFKHKKNV